MWAVYIVLMVIGFVVFFAGLWCFVVWIISQTSGWSKLARQYTTTQEPSGEVRSRQTIHLGAARYRNCVTIGAAKEGLYLAVGPLFRLGHPTLLIPWRDLGPAREVTQFFHRHSEMTIGSPPIATLRLPVELGGTIKQARR